MAGHSEIDWRAEAEEEMLEAREDQQRQDDLGSRPRGEGLRVYVIQENHWEYNDSWNEASPWRGAAQVAFTSRAAAEGYLRDLPLEERGKFGIIEVIVEDER